MSDKLHLVKQGDSPQVIEKKYATPWKIIYEYPANAFMKQRKGYPIHPGDRIAIPLSSSAVPLLLRPPHQEMTPRFKDFLSIVQWNIRTLLSLSAQHPAASTAKIHSTALPKTDPGVKAAKAGEVVGYKKGLPKVWGSVTLTASIESAWTVLESSLPAGAVMTSGYRSDADQARVINEYFAKYSGPSSIIEVEARRQWLLALTDEKTGKNKGLKIARVGGSPHRTGLAFDLSGADLDTMKAAVDQCATANPTKFPLLSTLTERKQNCLHVNLKY